MMQEATQQVPNPKYKRVLLKLSGERLHGGRRFRH